MSTAAPALACAAAAIVLVGRPRAAPDQLPEADESGTPGAEGHPSGGSPRPAGGAAGGAAGAPASSDPGDAAGSWASGRRLTAAAGVLGLAVALVVGGVPGVVAGVAAAIGVRRGVGRLEPADRRRAREHRLAELPLLLDLLAVCLRAGMPLVGAVEAVADVLGGPFRRDLATGAGLLRRGASPAASWASLADDPDHPPAARAAGRSAESGSKLAGAFERLAAERRAVLAATGETAARRAGVIAMIPLGLCFLPAFVCLGLVPIVLSLAGTVLP